MIYSLSNNTIIEDSIENSSTNSDKQFICHITFDELKKMSDTLEVNERVLYECFHGRTSKFESYEGFEYIYLKIPNLNDILKPSKKICIFFTKKMLTFICNEKSVVNDILSDAMSGELKFLSLSKFLHVFFDKLTSEDTYYIENLEQEISELEEGLITSKDDNYLNKIIVLRKKLLKLKRYYERLLNIAELIEENENGLIDKKTIKYFKMFTNRANRLCQSINNLRDYVTQVREAYQAQVDINQNQLMKLFTVVTTIFLPLTLIVGWYGMNFNMPEYGWTYGYSFVIIVSICIIAACIVWFKKKKWL